MEVPPLRLPLKGGVIGIGQWRSRRNCASPLKGGVIEGGTNRERCRSRFIEAGEIGEAVPALCGRDARAPRWSSSHDITFPPQGGSDSASETRTVYGAAAGAAGLAGGLGALGM